MMAYSRHGHHHQHVAAKRIRHRRDHGVIGGQDNALPIKLGEFEMERSQALKQPMTTTTCGYLTEAHLGKHVILLLVASSGARRSHGH
jgi:hypothetical protein